MTEQFNLSERKKAYFISDAHLGSLALNDNKQRELLLVRWLEDIRKDAGAVFFVGDIFDFWFEYKKVVPKGYVRILGKMAEIADSGIPVHFLTGNHDAWTFDYLPSELGIIVHHAEIKIAISGKKFFIAHGDKLDCFESGFLKKMFANRFLQKCFAWLHPRIGIAIAEKWSKNSRLMKNQEQFKNENEGLLVFAKSVLKQEEFDYMIFGHRHLLIDIPIETGTRFIILGDWINYFSYGVFDGSNFELKRYTK